MAKLGEVCDILNGYAFKSNQYTTSGVRIIRISNVQKGYIEDKSPVYYPCDDENVKKYELKQNDLLISLTGNVGRTALLEEKFLPAALNQRVSCVRLKEPDKVLKTYLFHLLNSDYFEQQCMKAAEGVAQKNLSPKWLFEYKIPIYSIERQKEISNTLDKIDLLIILRKQQLAKLDELVKARFVEMFGEPVSNPYKFEVRSLQNMLDDGIITYHLDGNHGSDYPRNEEFVESGVSYISANCIIDDTVNLNLAKHLTEERAAKLRKGIAQDEDVLFAHNATVGPVAILHTRETKVILGTSLTAYRCNKQRILPAYLKAYMQSEGFVRQYTKDMKQTTRNQVPITAQRKYLFIVPPLSLQNQFAAFVERVDQQKQTVQQSFEKLELMKKALMQEYFG